MFYESDNWKCNGKAKIDDDSIWTTGPITGYDYNEDDDHDDDGDHDND